MYVKPLIAAVVTQLFLFACSGDDDDPVATVALDGLWRSACLPLDASETTLDDFYFYQQMGIAGNAIVGEAMPFADSDCVTPLTVDFEYSGLRDATFALAEPFTTSGGLTAYPITITASGESASPIENIVARIDDVLYFGFDPLLLEAPDGGAAPTQLDLQNGYTLR